MCFHRLPIFSYFYTILHLIIFSVGQIRSDVATQLKVAAAVNSNTSVSSDRNIRGTSRRNTTKRKTYDETSSCDSLNEPQVKPIDEGSLLRRIIRSEMRKFIKVSTLCFM